MHGFAKYIGTSSILISHVHYFVSTKPYDHAWTKQLNKSCTRVKFFLAKEFQQ
jgi:hypothetical protein